MPWTFSHPAAVLPLRRLCPQSLDFAALVIGSTTPDIGYYLRRFDLSQFAHTLPGSFLACLPIGVVMLCLFFLFCRPVCFALPSPHRQFLLPLCPSFPSSVRRWMILLLSLLLGAWTHNFWDAFTHEHGWFVDRIVWLREPAFQIGSTTVQMFLFLQELSTLAGFAIVVFAYWRWLRRRPAMALRAGDVSNSGRYWLWFVLLGLSLGVSLPLAVHYAMSTPLHGFLFLRSIVFRTAIYSHAIALPFVLLGTGIVYLRRDR